jgi:predicted glycosyl hydrolase (DUF1957 family)
MIVKTVKGIPVSYEDLQESVYKDINAEKNLNRIVRDTLLAATDVWALSDRTMTAEQTAYRQALRDITDQAGFPTDITWPTKPE